MVQRKRTVRARRGPTGWSAFEVLKIEGVLDADATAEDFAEWLRADSANALLLDHPADGAISGHRAVILQADGSIAYASADDADHADAVLGVSVNAAADGDTVTVQAAGILIEASLGLTAGPVFVGLNGQLVSAPPPGAVFIRQVGAALAADRLLVDLRPPIRTA